MTRQYRQGDHLVRDIGPIVDRRSTVPSDGARHRASHRNNKGGHSVSRVREPGATLELLFQQNPDLKPGPFLAYVEQKFRLLGDIEALREIRAYRAKHSR